MRMESSSGVAEALQPPNPDPLPTPGLFERVVGDGDGRGSRLLARRARAILREQPGPVRRVIELRFFHQPRLSLAEIAELDDVSIGVIHDHLTTGLRALATGLRQYDGAL